MSHTSGEAQSRTRPIGSADRVGLLVIVALIALPHVNHFPIWVSLVATSLLLWQAIALRYRWRVPSGLIRAILTAAIVCAVFLGFGRISGQNAGVALLVLMLVLKLFEAVRYRDVMVVLVLCCFVLVTQFLFSQSIAMAAYLIGACWVVVAAFVHIHADDGAGMRAAAMESLRLLGLAVPVAALLFVLFPRLPGPLWSLPVNSANQARTGLSDRMSPGSIAQLARSDAVAFRARFTGTAPPPAQRYWRGPVFWDFANGTWRTRGDHRRLEAAHIRRDGPTRRVDITLAPSHQPWLIALDVPVSVDHPHHQAPGATLVADQPIDHRIRYIEHSATRYTLNAALSPAARRRALALPAGGNPKARALARRWAGQYNSPQAIVRAALSMFRQQPFRYTLRPPRTSQRNSVDDFLFDTRAGFCEHYAGAFTFLMRAAGVPARVVTGYQGAEHASVGDYWIVRDSDAHAWSEVWIAGRGWIRIDPTAAVAPSRIDDGVGAAIADTADLPFMARGRTASAWYQARMLWDAVDAGWNRWFLAYGPSLQARVFAFLGLKGAGPAVAALTGGIVAMLALISLWLAWAMRPMRAADPVLRAWRRVVRRLARHGLGQRTGEAPLAYAERVARTRPALGHSVRDLAQRFVRLRYGRAQNSDAERRAFMVRARRLTFGRLR